MRPLKDMTEAEVDLQARVVRCLDRAKAIAALPVASFREGLRRVEELRQQCTRISTNSARGSSS